MQIVSKIVPCLWFDSEAEEAARFYTSVFPGGRINQVSHYTKAGREIHGREPGSVLTVSFELAGQAFTALNGGPVFSFNEAVSLQILCDTQEEVDHFWSRLGAGGATQAQQCGWLKDRYGLSWQVIPRALLDWVADPDAAKAERTLAAIMGMKKLDFAVLKRAHDGA